MAKMNLISGTLTKLRIRVGPKSPQVWSPTKPNSGTHWPSFSSINTFKLVVSGLRVNVTCLGSGPIVSPSFDRLLTCCTSSFSAWLLNSDWHSRHITFRPCLKLSCRERWPTPAPTSTTVWQPVKLEVSEHVSLICFSSCCFFGLMFLLKIWFRLFCWADDWFSIPQSHFDFPQWKFCWCKYSKTGSRLLRAVLSSAKLLHTAWNERRDKGYTNLLVIEDGSNIASPRSAGGNDSKRDFHKTGTLLQWSQVKKSYIKKISYKK